MSGIDDRTALEQIRWDGMTRGCLGGEVLRSEGCLGSLVEGCTRVD